MSLCGRMSAITIVLALCAALGVAAWTGDDAGLKLAAAVALVGGMGLLAEFFGPKNTHSEIADTERKHAG